ncbi:hypothetical protein HAX54_042138 [Datura stramonium]|uniref:DUF4283 domain-containing protein n=1 Tax=Datura stramonium TaxID=4076 RepID=A0ABS8W080_DATST|nr:hypothetical protein [Datura stramonium]
MAWISFPNLLPTFFSKETLFSLASAVEEPMQLDVATLNKIRPICARVKWESGGKPRKVEGGATKVSSNNLKHKDILVGNKYEELREEDDNNDAVSQNNKQPIQETEMHSNYSQQDAISQTPKEEKNEIAKEWIESDINMGETNAETGEFISYQMSNKSREVDNSNEEIPINMETQIEMHRNQHAKEKPAKNNAILMGEDTVEAGMHNSMPIIGIPIAIQADESKMKRNSPNKVLHK